MTVRSILMMISPPLLASGKQWFVESVPPIKEEMDIIDQMNKVKKKLCEKTKEELTTDHNADEQLIPGHLNVFKKENGLWCAMVTAKDNADVAHTKMECSIHLTPRKKQPRCGMMSRNSSTLRHRRNHSI